MFSPRVIPSTPQKKRLLKNIKRCKLKMSGRKKETLFRKRCPMKYSLLSLAIGLAVAAVPAVSFAATSTVSQGTEAGALCAFLGAASALNAAGVLHIPNPQNVCLPKISFPGFPSFNALLTSSGGNLAITGTYNNNTEILTCATTCNTATYTVTNANGQVCLNPTGGND
jgi:hypothetical protein